MEMRNLILTATLALCAMYPANGADPRQQKPASGQSESDSSPRLLTTDEDQAWREATDDEREFTKRFNNLVRAMREFSNTYNVGHVVNVKQAKAVRKAMRDLEKSDWFHAPTAE